MDLSALTSPSRLEPDGASELCWTVASIHPPATHPSFLHSVTLSNTQAFPQVRTWQLTAFHVRPYNRHYW